MKTGIIIKELRNIKGITQEELAQKTGLNTITIQQIENGEVAPGSYTLQMIAKALDVDFSIFQENETDEDKDFKHVNDRNWLAFLHLSGLLPLFFPSFMIWNRKKTDRKEITEHYRAVITFQSTILFMYLLGFWVLYKAHNPRVIIIFLLLGAFFSIKNALNALNGKPYKYFGLFMTENKNNRAKLNSI